MRDHRPGKRPFVKGIAECFRPVTRAPVRAGGPIRGDCSAMNLPESRRTPSAVPDRGPVAAALAEAARIGPWFAVAVVAPGAPGAWRRWDELYAPPGSGGDPLSARIDQVAASLRTDRRVAASIAVQGMAARLVSMPFATVALHGVLPRLVDLHRDPSADDPWAPALPVAPDSPLAPGSPVEPGSTVAPDPVGASTPAVAPDAPVVGAGPGPAGVRTPDPRTDPDGAADLLAGELGTTHLEPLYAAVAARVSVSQRVLRGNVVSAIGGAARVMEAMRRADRPAFVSLLDALVGHPALRGQLPEGATGHLLRLDETDPDTEWSFRRHSCCLYVKTPAGATCGDCILP